MIYLLLHYSLIILCDSWESHSACTFRWKVLNNREAGRGGNSTVVVLVTGHHNVAILPPALSPAAVKKRKRIMIIFDSHE